MPRYLTKNYIEQKNLLKQLENEKDTSCIHSNNFYFDIWLFSIRSQ